MTPRTLRNLIAGAFYGGSLLLGAAGCAAPDAASTNVRAPEDRFAPNVVLGGSKADAAVAGMTGPAKGAPTRPLVVAGESGVRWADVPMALRNVAGTQFVGIKSLTPGAERTVAVTEAADGQRGTVTATLQPDGSVRLETCLGLFPDERRDGAFTRAFEAELRRLGRIPRPQA